MTKEERAALVAKCRASGLTAKEWCRQKGIKYADYCRWATNVNRDAQQSKTPRWANVTLSKEDDYCFLQNRIGQSCNKNSPLLQVAFPKIAIRWRKEYKEKGDFAFPGHGKQKLTPEQEEIQRLKKELRETQIERDILKKRWPSSHNLRSKISNYTRACCKIQH